MSNIKTFFRLSFSFFALIFIGCTSVRYYPVNFVESLQHPTKFPEVFSSNVQNIEEIADKNPLGENEDVKITDVGENKNSSMHLVQVRENGELRPHYHRRHDEVIYVKKGSGIATLDGTRYLIKPGSILQIPSKTVHKFLNTGGEPFMAVSIFSPPFDGRDEKTIKERKKAGRGVKEEKRLATKKPEKVTERNQTSTVKELTDEEIQTSTIKSKKVAEKKLNKPVQEELNSDTKKPSLPPEKVSPPESKKKSKGAITAKEPAINIEDMHEKLTRLLELKEEGTISAEEYEEKKDALVEGKDIGELPELKGHAKKRIPIEDEPVLNQAEKHIPMDKDISSENQDTMLSTPSLSEEGESTIHEIASQQREPSSEDKLKTLEEMKQEGLITGEDYESKKKELIGTAEEETATMPSENTIGDERVEELKDLYDQGLITEDDYEYKLKELTGAQTQSLSPNISTEKGDENDKLSELNELKEQGLISEEDYEFKKAQLLGN